MATAEAIPRFTTIFLLSLVTCHTFRDAPAPVMVATRPAGSVQERTAPIPARDDAVFARVSAEAEALRERPFHDQVPSLPSGLDTLDYDAHRDIRFRPAHALWKKEQLQFQVQFFHRGFLFPRPIRMSELSHGTERTLDFTTALFDYGRNPVPRSDREIGFAGFRVHTRLNRQDYFDEVAVFLGGTYFRLIGSGQVYGASARGLAIDIALANGEEEFPFFRQFWVERPQPTAKSLSIHALLDSRSVTGAYRFVITPGDPSIAEVDARLFFRHVPEKVGIAPLTSMFLFGETTPARFEDYRPEVHDSDGLLIHDSTLEWLYRPLNNPSELAVSAFAMKSPRGFGLVQRDRVFDHYVDLEAHYERRPNLWITPRGDWGSGHVELVEIPTERETHDNIVAYWVSAERPSARMPLELGYRVEAALHHGSESPGGRAIATRIAPVDPLKPAVQRDPSARRFLVDFTGKDLQLLGPKAKVEAVVSVARGRVIGPIDVERLPVEGSMRAQFTVRRDAEESVELRAFLRNADEALTETWSYRWDKSDPNGTAPR